MNGHARAHHASLWPFRTAKAISLLPFGDGDAAVCFGRLFSCCATRVSRACFITMPRHRSFHRRYFLSSSILPKAIYIAGASMLFRQKALFLARRDYNITDVADKLRARGSPMSRVDGDVEDWVDAAASMLTGSRWSNAPERWRLLHCHAIAHARAASCSRAANEFRRRRGLDSHGLSLYFRHGFIVSGFVPTMPPVIGHDDKAQ